MNRGIDDPGWTAYLLGELSALEVREAEAQLQADPQLQKEVEELKVLLQHLQEELSEPAPPVFDPLRREAVLRPQQTKSHSRLWLPTAIAALFAIGFGISHYLTLSTPPVSETAPEEEEHMVLEVKENLDRVSPMSAPVPSELNGQRAPSPSVPAPAPVLEAAAGTFKPRRAEESVSRQLGDRETQPADFKLDNVLGSELSEGWTFEALKEENKVEPTPTPTPTPELEIGPGAPPPPRLP